MEKPATTVVHVRVPQHTFLKVSEMAAKDGRSVANMAARLIQLGVHDAVSR